MATMKRLDELPARANPHIYQVEDSSGRIDTARDLGIPINRYRYVWNGSGSPSMKATSALLAKLIESMGENVWAIEAWRKDRPTKARDRLQRHRHVKAGCDVYEYDCIVVSTRPIAVASDIARQLLEWPVGNQFLLIQRVDAALQQFSNSVLPTLRDFALANKLRPGRGFLEFLREHSLSCVYMMTDDYDRQEIVLLTNELLERQENTSVK